MCVCGWVWGGGGGIKNGRVGEVHWVLILSCQSTMDFKMLSAGFGGYPQFPRNLFTCLFSYHNKYVSADDCGFHGSPAIVQYQVALSITVRAWQDELEIIFLDEPRKIIIGEFIEVK